MVGLISVGLVVAVMVVAGRIIFRGSDDLRQFAVLRVLGSFMGVMLVNALIMLLCIGVSLVVELALIWCIPSWNGMFFTADGRLAAHNLLLYLFLIIFVTAFIHYGLRRPLLSRLPLFALDEDEYQLFEYFIQWITIYLVVYQCFFEGFQDFATWAELADGATIRAIFSIALSPQNINLIVQPLLISSWILVVLERFARRNSTDISN